MKGELAGPVLLQSLPTSAYIYRHPLSPCLPDSLPLPLPQGIELLIAFFHVEVSHFLQLCQGSPELRRGWLLLGEVGRVAERGRLGVEG